MLFLNIIVLCAFLIIITIFAAREVHEALRTVWVIFMTIFLTLFALFSLADGNGKAPSGTVFVLPFANPETSHTTLD